MVREDVLCDLLYRDTVSYPNTILLKKFLLTAHHGWIKVNGLAPDKQYSLGDYLLDDERLMLDFTRLSEQSREKFLNWFLVPHKRDANLALPTGVTTNEYRGYTAEVGLSWWGRITNLLYYKKKSYHWHIAPLEISLNYQFTGMEINQGKHGLLVGFNQFLTEKMGNKYHDPDDNQVEPLRNTKRVLLTEKMVDQLTLMNLDTPDYDAIVRNPHPFSIDVSSYPERLKAMYDHRQTQRFIQKLPVYINFWRSIKTGIKTLFAPWFFKPVKKEANALLDDYLTNQPIIEDKNVSIFNSSDTGQILVIEKRPELDSMVFCGGGARIFAHVGAYKAFEEAGIKPSRFSGSSAGAIMAVLCYMGYSSDEIYTFFQGFKQDNLIHYNIDSSGISDTKALKAALDYMTLKKVNEIIDRYQLEASPEGKKFLNKKIFKNNNKITFGALKALKTAFPDCGLGDELTVTATNATKNITSYFSHKTVDIEVSEAVKISASLPVVYKPTILDGDKHNDGGILSNFPTEVFKGDGNTLLESDQGNCLSLVAFQFDTGIERGILDKLVHKVYRENFFWNWFYGFLTGVKDPVSGWERDRLKLLQYSNQVVILPVSNVSSTNFNIDSAAQQEMINNGHEAAMNYIKARYELTPDGAVNDEYMYSNFSSMDELLHFCCYRGHAEWFERIAEKMDSEQINFLREQYFPTQSGTPDEISNRVMSGTLFNTPLELTLERKLINVRLFQAVYPILNKIPDSFIKNPHDLKFFKLARHNFAAEQPIACLKILDKIKGDVHIVFYLFIQLLHSCTQQNFDDTCAKLKTIESLLTQKKKLGNSSFSGNWRLLPRQEARIFNALTQGKLEVAQKLCASLIDNEEPMQTIMPTIMKEKDIPDEGVEEDDHTDYWCLKGDRPCASA